MSSEQADPELSESAQQINDLARLKKGADFRGGGRARPAGLHAVYHAGQDGVGQIERVLGVLRQASPRDWPRRFQRFSVRRFGIPTRASR
ncbi:hypothetical protein IVB16_34770 [Bradyrhizobium sp. 183]|uniref:hypothetical protein n=1 Tax=unclassified Bradyrhizobium TaxID=2631580 RepID=UPI001FFF151A|nr:MULTISPECIES: hypothetical protein [unclassified Bradyrhizobium]UPJ79752.1 hypothetical protein IVB17_34765 [Bradyrhizobium sp. 184]UPJ87547.1 hypothetical protein IVB16_34770 [Bradyrhizobium sp. 183]